MEILGLEFTSSSYAVTINDVAVAQRAEWVARSVLPWAKIDLVAKAPVSEQIDAYKNM
jgi:hypothetical protein